MSFVGISYSSDDSWWESCGKHYYELQVALRTRPLTVAELAEVGAIGYSLLVQPMTPYYAAEKQAEFAALLSIQQSIQLASKHGGQGGDAEDCKSS